MARSKFIKKIQKSPDIVYKSRVITKAINMLMLSGKKSVAKDIIYGVLLDLNEEKKEARRIFEDAVKNVMPEVEVKGRRIGGANYSIPVPVKHDRAETLALRWIITSCRDKKGKTMRNRLVDEIKAAFNKEGNAILKKINTHKMADANKAFAFFKW